MFARPSTVLGVQKTYIFRDRKKNDKPNTVKPSSDPFLRPANARPTYREIYNFFALCYRYVIPDVREIGQTPTTEYLSVEKDNDNDRQSRHL